MSDTNKECLGTRVRAQRKHQKLSLEALGEAAGVDWKIIQKIETRPSKKSVYATAIASALGVDLDWLTNGKTANDIDQESQAIDELISLLKGFSENDLKEITEYAKFKSQSKDNRS